MSQRFHAGIRQRLPLSLRQREGGVGVADRQTDTQRDYWPLFTQRYAGSGDDGQVPTAHIDRPSALGRGSRSDRPCYRDALDSATAAGRRATPHASSR